jgi:phenylacetate-coenzyme A ligase PaaK-like adenylate-forming protein
MLHASHKNLLVDFYSKIFTKYPFLKLQLRFQEELLSTDKYLIASWDNYLNGHTAHFVHKDQVFMKEDLHELCNSSDYRELRAFATFQTSGTSGLPVPVKRDIYSTSDVFFSPLIKALLKRRDIEFGKENIFSCFISDRPGMSDSVLINPTGTTGLFTKIRLNSVNPDSYTDVIDKLNVMQPEVVTSKPNLLENLLVIHRKHQRITTKFSAVISSGGMLSVGLKEELEAAFNCPVVNSYGATEFGYIASSCSRGNLHIDDSTCLIQDGGNLGLLISSHVNPLLKLDRYAIGDQGSLSREACHCGNKAPYIINLNGRSVVQFVLSNGRKISPTCLMNIFSDNPDLEEFQLTQTGIGEFRLRLQSQKDIAANISAYIQKFIPEPIHIQCEYTQIKKDSKFLRYRKENV